jgi:hypothetical protein
MTTLTTNSNLEKRYICEMIDFALTHIPQSDAPTLKRFRTLVVVGGSHGTITQATLLNHARTTLKYTPHTCPQSIFIMLDLLGLPLEALQTDWLTTLGELLPSLHLSASVEAYQPVQR